MDEFIALRMKASSFECNEKNTNNLNGLSKYQSKNIKFEEYCKCLFGGEHQKPKNKCDNYLIRSLNHEMYLQKVKKSTLFPIDDKRCYENIIKNQLWK